jgi:16S rRNA (cytosine1402-N4)-methyltransferase
MQLDDPARGFSYKHDGPLDMRMDERVATSAAAVITGLTEAELSGILRDYADEPDHERIARHIVRRRSEAPIQRTRELVNIVLEAKGLSRRGLRRRGARPARDGRVGDTESADGGDTESGAAASDRPGRRLHPAARTFQALRMFVNGELAGLSQLLRIAPYCLKPGGRLGIISFHSREGVRSGLYVGGSAAPIRPTRDEVRANPRAASAKFRVAVHA